MTQVLIVGCGDLGGAVAAQLASLGVDVLGVRRSRSTNAAIRMIAADVTQPASLEQLKFIQPRILIYCVAANGQSDVQYKAHYVDGLKQVLATQADNARLQHVFFVSSTRVYGQVTDALLDETVVATPADFGGERLLEAENLLATLSCNSTVLRLSGIYGNSRLRMINLARNPENWPADNSWSNRIHRDDAAAFIVFLVHQVLSGNKVQHCFIVTDSMPAPQHEVLHWLAAQLKTETEPNFLANTPVPVAGGKRLSNQAMLATGFKLQYPNFRVGYQAVLSQYQAQDLA